MRAIQQQGFPCLSLDIPSYMVSLWASPLWDIQCPHKCQWCMFLHTLLYERDMTQGHFKRSLIGLNSEFSFVLTGYHNKIKKSSLSYFFLISGGRIVEFKPFPKVLRQCEMQTAWPIYERGSLRPFPITITSTTWTPLELRDVTGRWLGKNVVSMRICAKKNGSSMFSLFR